MLNSCHTTKNFHTSGNAFRHVSVNRVCSAIPLSTDRPSLPGSTVSRMTTSGGSLLRSLKDRHAVGTRPYIVPDSCQGPPETLYEQLVIVHKKYAQPSETLLDKVLIA